MFDKKFNIIRIVIIILTVCSLAYIYHIEKPKEVNNNKKEEIIVTKDTVIEAAKKYVNNHQDYFNDVLKEDMEYRLDTNSLISESYIAESDDIKGYVSIKNGEYSFVSINNLLINKIIDNNNLKKEENNEGMPFDISYVYKGDPNNYIIINDEEYRIVGITNSDHLKLVKTSKETIEYWGNSGNINYFSGETVKEETNPGVKGIFYVGYIRSETSDLSQIIKNEKRNNNYTKILPKFYGYYSYLNVSDIVNASENCNFKNVTNIKIDTCDSYLLKMISDTYLSNTLENDLVYYVDSDLNIKGKSLEENININKVIYVNGVSKYNGGSGTKDDPYIYE